MMNLVQRNSLAVILVVIAVLGCMKSPGQLSHHGRSFSEGSYHGFWKSQTNGASFHELEQLLIFYHGKEPFQGSQFVGPKLHTTTQRGLPLDKNGFTLAPEGLFLNGKPIEGSAGERVFVVLLFKDCKVIPVSLSASELESLSRDRIQMLETTAAWKKIVDIANAE